MLARFDVSARATEPRAVRQFAAASERAGVFFPASEAAIAAWDRRAILFAQREIDRTCAARKIAGGCKNAPALSSSAQKGNYETRLPCIFSTCSPSIREMRRKPFDN